MELFDQQALKQIFPDATTTVQVKRIINSLDQASHQLYIGEHKLWEILVKSFTALEAEQLRQWFEKLAVQVEDVDVVRKLFDNLKQQLLALSVVKVWIAMDLPHEFWQNLAKQLTQGSDKGVVFEFRLEESLLAGAIWEINGKRYDYSLRHQLNQWLDDGGKKAIEKWLTPDPQV